MNPSASRVRKSGSSITYSYISIVQLRKVTLHGLALSAGRRFHKNPHAPFSTRSNAHPRLTQYSGGGGHRPSVDVNEGELVYLDRRPCSDSPDRCREIETLENRWHPRSLRKAVRLRPTGFGRTIFAAQPRKLVEAAGIETA